jgi:hypothetical protein
MNVSENLLKSLAASGDRSTNPLQMVWPIRGNPVALIEFSRLEDWQAFVGRLGLQRATPDIVRLKFERAQKLYLLGWLEFDVIKAGELAALAALELALKDRYGQNVRDKRGEMKFARLLDYLVTGDGLSDAKIPTIQKSGGTAIPFLTLKTKTTQGETKLSDIRNNLAHGYPFDGFPYGGLLELARDLIEYAYRNWP